MGTRSRLYPGWLEGLAFKRPTPAMEVGKPTVAFRPPDFRRSQNQVATIEFSEFASNGKAKSVARHGLIEPASGLHHLIELLGNDPGAIVLDLKHNVLVLEATCNGDRTACPFEGVVEDVPEFLVQVLPFTGHSKYVRYVGGDHQPPLRMDF